MRKYFRKVREYERAYLEGKKAGKEVEAAVKVYKSHRRVFLRILLTLNTHNFFIYYSFKVL